MFVCSVGESMRTQLPPRRCVICQSATLPVSSR